MIDNNAIRTIYLGVARNVCNTQWFLLRKKNRKRSYTYVRYESILTEKKIIIDHTCSNKQFSSQYIMYNNIS
jgi:hypothetical protein